MPKPALAALCLHDLFILVKNPKLSITHLYKGVSKIGTAFFNNFFASKGITFQSFCYNFLLVSLFFLLGYTGVAQTIPVTYSTPGTYSWTVPAGVSTINVQAWGGGAGGFPALSGVTSASTSGGGGGAYASSVIEVSQGQIFTIVVGAGGQAIAFNPRNGSNTSFSLSGNTIVDAEGGFASTRADIGGLGGRSANSTGQYKFSGGAGGSRGTSNSAGGGGGGASAFTNSVGGAGLIPAGNTGGLGGIGTGNGGQGGSRSGTEATRTGKDGLAPGGGGGGKGGNGDALPGSGAPGSLTISVASSSTYNFRGTYIFKIPPGVNEVSVEAWGGGAGGWYENNNQPMRGGGGGAFAGSKIAVIPGQEYEIEVGQGGGPGANGSSSRFRLVGASSWAVVADRGISSTAGPGGTVANSTGTTRRPGGAGGNKPNGTSGGGGGGGGSATPTANGGNGVVGGTSVGGNGGTGTGFGGKGGNNATAQRNGFNGLQPGGGGGGRGSGTDAGNIRGVSGSGADGQVVVSWVSPIGLVARYVSLDAGAALWCQGETRTVKINIENNGANPWTSGTANGNVNLYWWWSNQSNTDNAPVMAFANLPSGNSQEVSFTVTPPSTLGNYTLNFDLRSEGNCWFSDNTGACGPGNLIYTSSQFSINEQPTVSAGTSIFTCTGYDAVNITGGATATKYDYIIWSTPNGTGIMVDENTLDLARYQPSSDDSALLGGTVSLNITAVNGGCIAEASKTLTITNAPTVNVTPTGEVCSNISPINFATGTTATNTSSVVWSTNGTGTLNNNNQLATANYLPSLADISSASVTFTLTATGTGGCDKTVVANKVVAITQEPLITTTGGNISVCSNAINFPVGTGATVFSSPANGQIWTTGGSANTLANEILLNGVTYTPSKTDSTNGTVTLTLRASGNGSCADAIATKIVTIVPAPFVHAGINMPVCKNTTTVAIGTDATSLQTTSVLWTSSGTGGTITNPTSLTGATYQPSAADMAAGTVTLTLTGTGNGPCTTAVATKVVTFTDIPSGTISFPVSAVCKTDGLINITSTATPGGVFSVLPAGLTIDAYTGQVNLSSSTPGNYTITYTLASLGGCSTFVTTTNLTVTALLTPFIAYNGAPFCTSINSPRGVTLSGGGTGGTFSAVPSTLNLNTTTGAITFPGPGPGGTYEVTYSLPAAGGCPAVSATTTVTITVNPNPIINYYGTPFCSNSGSIGVTLLNGPTGGTYSSLTSGLSINSTTGEVNAITSLPGTYTVRYFKEKEAGSGCNDASDLTTITITPLPVATFTYGASQFCRSSGNIAPTFTGGGTGGVFSSTAGLVFANTSTGEINMAASTPGTYTVTNTIAAALGCGVVSATDIITITALPVAGFQYAGTPYCNNGVNPLPVFDAGATAGTFSALGGLAISPSTGLINLAGSTPGTYTVTNAFPANGGCPAVSNTSAITITPLPTANISYAGGPFCNTISTPISVSRTGTGGFTAGTYTVSPAGLTIDANTGSITPYFASVAAPAGDYTVSYTIGATGGCGVVVTNTTVTILPQGTLILASGSGNKNQTFCIDLPVTNITHNLGGGASFASVTGLPAGITGNLNAGVFTIAGTPTVSGTFNYTITAAGNCLPITSTGTLTVQANATLTLSSLANTVVQNICAGPSIAPVIYNVGGNVTGVNVTGLPAGVIYTYNTGLLTISGSPSSNGIYNYTITTTGPCINATASGTIRIDALAPVQPSAISGPSGLCPAVINVEYEVPSIAAAAVYNWSLPTGWSITAGAGTNKITVALSGATAFGPNNIQVNAANGCGASSNQNTNVTISNFAAVTINPVQPICAGENISLTAVFGGAAIGTGGKWEVVSGTANVANINAASTTYTPSATDRASGLVTFKNTTNFVPGTCQTVGTDQITVIIKPTPTATITGTTTICEGGSTNITISGTALTTVSYTINGGAAQTVNLDASGTTTINTGVLTTSATYALTQVGYTTGTICTQPLNTNAVVTVNPLVVVNAGANQTVCSNGSITLNGSITGGTTTGTWTATSGNFGSAGVLNTIYTPSISSGTVLLTLTSYDPAGPCTQQAATMLVTVNPVATVSAGAEITICQGSVAILAGSFGGGAGSVTWTGGTGTFSNAGSPVSNYTPSISSGSETLTITTNDPSGPCNAVSATVLVSVNLAPTVSAGSDFAICSNGTASLNGSFGGSATSGTWTTSGTGTFNDAALGNAVYTPSTTDKAIGFVVLTYTTNKPSLACNTKSASITITISPIPFLVVNAGAEQTICQGEIINLTGVSDATTVTWGAPAGTGTFGNANSLITTFTPSITNGSVILTLTTNDPDGPCLAQVSTKTVTVNPAPVTPIHPTGLVTGCGAATIPPNASSIPDVTWYWQNSYNNRSTANNASNAFFVTLGGNFYINARDNTSGCWSLGSDTIKVSTFGIPSAPTDYSTNTPQCAGSTVTLTRGTTIPANTAFFWQTTETGTEIGAINAAVTYTATASGTYYLRRLTTNTGCWSTATPIPVVISPAPAVPGNPSVPTAECITTGTTLVRNGTPGTNVSWFWQTVVNGTNTSNNGVQNTVFSSGTYYIRAKDNITGCWSLGEGSVNATVHPLPTIPPDPVNNGSQCNIVTLTRTGTVPSNTTWYWQTSSTGTDMSNASATFNVTTAGTYYLRARTDNGCWSTGSGSVNAAFLTLPAAPAISDLSSNAPQCVNDGVIITRNPDPNLAVTWYWQGTNASGTSEGSSSLTYPTATSGTYYLRAKNNAGCWSTLSAAINIVVNPLPSAPTGSITVAGFNNCEDIGATLTRSASPSGPVKWYWQSVATEQLETNSSNTYLSQVAGNNYKLYLRAKDTLTGCWSASALASADVTVRPNPLPNILANYCAIPGKVLLNVSASPTPVTFNWSPIIPATNPNTGQSYQVDVAGIFNVNVTYAGGCTRSNFIQVSENQVTNGDFTQGNTGFTTALYEYRADLPGVNNELIPEGLYAVGTNGQNYHPNFWGIDHTRNLTGPRNSMIVNGRGDRYIVWQQTVNVLANTDYYFSAYAMSINQVPPYARLKFEINGELVGTVAELGPGPSNNTQANANNYWIRFYSQPIWNSGAVSGPVTLRIVNLEDALNGNDFAIDDISFGSLSPLPISNLQILAESPVCPGTDIQLNVTFDGGRAPFTYRWLGPDGFASNNKNPVIPSAVGSKSGRYLFGVVDGYGCAERTVSSDSIAVLGGLGGYWTGAYNTDWYNCLNWASGTLPTSTTDVTLPSSSTEVLIGKPSVFYNGRALARDISISRPLRFLNHLDTLDVYGRLNITANTGLVNTASGGDISILGEGWYNNRGTNGFVTGTGSRVSFMGSATTAQTINHITGKETFHNLTINNTGSAVNNVIANDAVDVNGVFTISNGKMLTTSTDLLTVINPEVTSVVGGSNAAFVNGPMERQMNATNEYYYPIGKLGSPYQNYRPPAVIPKTNNNHRFRAEYFNTTPPNASNYLDLINGIVKSEWWQIDRMAGTDSAKVMLRYITPNGPDDWQGPQPPDNAYAVAVIKNSETAGTGSWYFTPFFSADNNSGYSLTGPRPESIPWHSQTGMGTPVYSKYMQSFSPFGFGYAYYQLLPIRLLSFTGTIENKQSLLKWTVADNAEVKSFTVEHSTDGVLFTAAGTMPKGNTAAYKFYHNGLVPGANYYRLLMHGKDGTKVYSNIVVLNYGLLTTTITGIKPTLAHDLTYVSVISAKNQPIHIRIFDTRGRLVRTEKASLHQGINTVPVLTRNLANAMYHIHVLTDDGVQANYKIMKE